MSPVFFLLASYMKMPLQRSTPVTWPFYCHNTLTATAHQLIFIEDKTELNIQWHNNICSSLQQQLQNKTLFNSWERLLLGTLIKNKINWIKSCQKWTSVWPYPPPNRDHACGPIWLKRFTPYLYFIEMSKWKNTFKNEKREQIIVNE